MYIVPEPQNEIPSKSNCVCSQTNKVTFQDMDMFDSSDTGLIQKPDVIKLNCKVS